MTQDLGKILSRVNLCEKGVILVPPEGENTIRYVNDQQLIISGLAADMACGVFLNIIHKTDVEARTFLERVEFYISKKDNHPFLSAWVELSAGNPYRFTEPLEGYS